ncbi:MAG: hypothetical protein MZV64_43120 [Ignavibacteriales bacterium]|nr:hypothetical protein [Ignavibacteriales bacterium]
MARSRTLRSRNPRTRGKSPSNSGRPVRMTVSTATGRHLHRVAPVADLVDASRVGRAVELQAVERLARLEQHLVSVLRPGHVDDRGMTRARRGPGWRTGSRRRSSSGP